MSDWLNVSGSIFCFRPLLCPSPSCDRPFCQPMGSMPSQKWRSRLLRRTRQAGLGLGERLREMGQWWGGLLAICRLVTFSG
jgi:hypothetical protein